MMLSEKKLNILADLMEKVFWWDKVEERQFSTLVTPVLIFEILFWNWYVEQSHSTCVFSPQHDDTHDTWLITKINDIWFSFSKIIFIVVVVVICFNLPLGEWSLGLIPFGLKSLGLMTLVTWLNFFKLSVSGVGHEFRTFRQKHGGGRFGKKNMPKRLRL